MNLLDLRKPSVAMHAYPSPRQVHNHQTRRAASRCRRCATTRTQPIILTEPRRAVRISYFFSWRPRAARPLNGPTRWRQGNAIPTSEHFHRFRPRISGALEAARRQSKNSQPGRWEARALHIPVHQYWNECTRHYPRFFFPWIVKHVNNTQRKSARPQDPLPQGRERDAQPPGRQARPSNQITHPTPPHPLQHWRAHSPRRWYSNHSPRAGDPP